MRLQGVVPRAAQALFEKLQGTSNSSSLPRSGIRSPQRYSTHGIPTLSGMHRQQPSTDKDWQLRATYVEIYNEQLRDLLIPESVPQADRGQVSIREDTKGRILLTGLTQLPINSVEDLLNALQFGSAIRQTDATAINAKSSRSHAVFSLNLVQKKSVSSKDRRLSVPLEAMASPETSVTIDSKLHFVDLAGSERLKNTGAQGERAKEGISINAGLASLGKVISQLSARHHGGHVSYRDSRLTRLLQDSLGGNAITYMVACVTPAEFHLSETLNTVTYAQRARAIQSKPEIQQTNDDKDNTVKLERLQAEVAFLRDQIKHERSSEERNPMNGDRLSARREKELQEQLMDMQESYNALSQRHAKLIAEISRARDNPDEEMPTAREAIGDSAMERLRRSNSLSEAVEQVVVEYEKTIQSLEASLSNTRSTLSNSESTLMERESKIAYMENLAQQLQARLQKASDRESNNDAYLRELETQIEGATSSEEKSASLVTSLRKELSRIKDNESNAEEYISTLEERLAEAEQDQEIMQREIDRLEHVIERQRSIGRLDNLLAELDSIRQNEIDAKISNLKQTNGHAEENSPAEVSHEKVASAFETGHDDQVKHDEPEKIPQGEVINDEVEDDEEAGQTSESADKEHKVYVTKSTETSSLRPMSRDEQHAAQSSFMADKLETTMQELFDLRGEHEATMNEKQDLQRKYDFALQTLAKLQEEQSNSVDSSRPQSFLGHAGVNINAMVDGQEPTSSSRSLESELSSLPRATPTLSEELNESTEMPTEEGATEEKPAEVADLQGAGAGSSTIEAHGETVARDSTAVDQGMVATEIEILRKQHLEHQDMVKELSSSYEQLQKHHHDTLGQLETLKVELSRASALRPSSPHSPLRSPNLRRKLSQDLVGSMTNNDRTTRSFASLRNIALDNFERNIDLRQNFELHLNTIMTELHDRSQKVEALDAEVQSSKKELEGNQKIIAGLTRERSSLQASSGVDLTVVGQMQSQLQQSEHQLRSLQETHIAKEREWQEKFDDLKSQLEQHKSPAVGENDAEAGAEQSSKDVSPDSEHASHISRLQNELASWETKHNDAMTAMKASEASLLATIAALEVSKTAAEHNAKEVNDRHALVLSDHEKEVTSHQETIAGLQKQVDEYQAATSAHVDQLSKFEQSHSAILQQVDEHAKSKELTLKELQTHRELVSNLESQLDSHKATIAVHEANLETLLGNLKTSHESELAQMKAAALDAEKASNEKHAALLEEHTKAVKDLEEKHQSVVSTLQQEIDRKQEDLEELLGSAGVLFGHETDVGRFHGHLTDALAREGPTSDHEWEEKYTQAVTEHEAMRKEFEELTAKHTDLENRVAELMAINADTLKNLEEVSQRELKSTRLVQELEEQITNNFDQHEAATKRLSAMQDRQVEFEEAKHARNELEKELEDARLKISLLESQIADMGRRSLASTSRESFGRDSGMTWRDSLSPEAAAIALARSSMVPSINNNSVPGSRPRSNHAPSSGAPPSTALPSPPPAIPLPPLPNSPNFGSTSPVLNGPSIDARAASPSADTTRSRSPETTSHFTGLPALPSPFVSPVPSGFDNSALQAKVDEQDSRLRTLEKHLFAEKQLTATLEEALVDLETSTNKHKTDSDAFRRKCKDLEDELVGLRREKTNSRASLQQVEEEREMRVRAERARMALEERMKELNSKDGKKKKKGGALNCF